MGFLCCSEWQWVAVSGSVLQCVAVCCRVLQCVAVCRSALQGGTVRCRALQCMAVCGSVWQFVAVYGSVLQCVAVCCSVWQCVAIIRQYSCTHLHWGASPFHNTPAQIVNYHKKTAQDSSKSEINLFNILQKISIQATFESLYLSYLSIHLPRHTRKILKTALLGSMYCIF